MLDTLGVAETEPVSIDVLNGEYELLTDAQGDELPLTDGVSEPVPLMENVLRLEDDIEEDTEPDEVSE